MGVLLACLAIAAAQAAESDPIRLEVSGVLHISADGAKVGFTPDRALNPQIAAQVERSTATWKFAATGPQGRPVDGDTGVRLALEAVPQSGGYGLRLMQAWFGTPALAPDATPPDYPRVLLEARAGARVLLQLRLDAQGRVTDASIMDTAVLTHIKDAAIRGTWRERFEQASLAAARRWTFVAGSTQAGVATYPRDVRMLVTFWPRDIKGDTDYRHVGWPMDTSPWAIKNKTTLPPGSVLVDPRVVPVDSVLSFRTDVVGSML